jgi:two-component sensor histidine kinase
MEEFAVLNHILKKRGCHELEFTPIQKELILKEINFHIKNNLNTIASLFGLQILNAKNAEDQALSKVLQINKVRINIFSILHERVYHQNGKQITLDKYIDRIINLINSETKHFVPVAVEIDDSLFLPWEKMIKLGMVIGELYTNSLQYAFLQSSEDDFVKISLSKDDEKYKFIYHEYHKYPVETEIGKLFNANTIGIKLIKMNIAQLQGEFTVKNEQGLLFSIIFL